MNCSAARVISSSSMTNTRRWSTAFDVSTPICISASLSLQACPVVGPIGLLANSIPGEPNPGFCAGQRSARGERVRSARWSCHPCLISNSGQTAEPELSRSTHRAKIEKPVFQKPNHHLSANGTQVAIEWLEQGVRAECTQTPDERCAPSRNPCARFCNRNSLARTQGTHWQSVHGEQNGCTTTNRVLRQRGHRQVDDLAEYPRGARRDGSQDPDRRLRSQGRLDPPDPARQGAGHHPQPRGRRR